MLRTIGQAELRAALERRAKREDATEVDVGEEEWAPIEDKGEIEADWLTGAATVLVMGWPVVLLAVLYLIGKARGM